MNSERVPSRSEVTGWSPQQLANYLKRMNLAGSDKVVIKNNINGSRFVNLTENDIQKFPKLQAPMISKISSEISRKEEKRGLFSRKPTTKYQEPDVTPDDHWPEDEFEDEFDDYESPYSGDEKASGSDYESPNEDDYEPTPSEPPEDMNLFPTRPIGDSDYIDNRNNHVSSGPPPILSPRPPVAPPSAQSRPMLGDASSSRRDHSPHTGARGKLLPEPPQVSRENKPGRNPTSSLSLGRGPPSDRPSTNNWKAQQDAPPNSPWLKPPMVPPSSTSISRSNSSARTPPNRPAFEAKRDVPDEVIKHNTFPLQNKSLRPVPGLPGPLPGHGDSLPPHLPSTASLPHKLSAAMAEHKSDFPGHQDRHSFRPPPSPAGRTQQVSQELDPRWYVGRVTRGQAEGCLRRVHKDGAYLVRDSTRQLAEQPFTLMVLYQTKVYNIQIREKNQQFLLGTGLKVQESFPSVSSIISHYSQSPLLLIDAKNRGSSHQNQCLLSEPAGYSMTSKDWS